MKKIDDFNLEKYSRQIIIDEVGENGQLKIINSKIAIVGCGGLGTSAAQYLSMSGVGNLLLIDYDKIDLSNLNRQTLFTEKEIGKGKSKTLSEKLKKINSNAKISFLNKKLTSKTISSYLNGYGMILDCTDNFESRILINEFCHKRKKILVSSALQSFDIQAFIFASWLEDDNPCYRCIFPNISEDLYKSCNEMGILSSTAGIGGLIQANLALNYVLGLKVNFKEFILLDCMNLNLQKIKINKNKKCPTCNK